jgi:NAD(P)-dependent dehydrogenase (short-subunit alcohol dehydrogenase family)
VIINVSSLSAIVAQPFEGTYAASKRALEGMIEALHYELGPFGVRVHLVEPGRARTDFVANRVDTSEGPYGDFSTRWAAAFSTMTAFGEPGSPQSVADSVYQAAVDPEAPLRLLVGQDAELLAALRKQFDDTEFEQTVRSALDFWDGALPPVV